MDIINCPGCESEIAIDENTIYPIDCDCGKAITKEMAMKLKSPEPEWIGVARYKFVDQEGVEWFARINGDGSVSVTSKSVLWEQKTVMPREILGKEYREIVDPELFHHNRPVKVRSPAQIFFPHLLLAETQVWLASILGVAQELQKLKKQGIYFPSKSFLARNLPLILTGWNWLKPKGRGRK